MIESILVPEERAKVINAKVIARVWDTKGIKVTLEGNSVTFEGEGLELLAAKNFIKAIGRGFSPIRAQRLLEDEEAQLEIVELDFGESRLRTVRSRLIGSGGKTRALLEESTGVVVSIYGGTVAMIGNWAQVRNARQAVEMLISGSMHKTVYRFLESIKV